MACLLVSLGASAARAEREILGEASHIIRESIVVAPDGQSFAAVTVDPSTKQRKVIVNCKRSGGVYDLIAKDIPIFSPDGRRMVFVASRGGDCFVVVDGVEGKGYEITGDDWPIFDLVFSPTGRHVAYKTRQKGGNYLVVDGQEFGPYEDTKTDEGKTVPGILTFRFAGDDGDRLFSYRAITKGGMVACLGLIGGEKIELTTSRAYETIGADTPVWLRGQKTGDRDLFAFIAGEAKKEFIAFLPEPPQQDVKPKLYDAIRRGSLLATPSAFGFVAAEAGKWKVVIGGNEWMPCDGIGDFMHSPDGSRWACIARIDTNIVMVVDGNAGPACSGIREHPGTVFLAGDNRVIYTAFSNDVSRVIVEGKEGDPYRWLDGSSVVFGPQRSRMAYVAGDGTKRFAVLEGRQGPPFDRVWNLRFNPDGKGFAYGALEGTKKYVVVNGLAIGPYENIGPDSPVFSPDGLTVAWTALGTNGTWRVYVNGEAGPPFDAIVSQLTFAPDACSPFYVARMLSGGNDSFVMVSAGGMGRKYTSIWMGDGGRLFVRNDGQAVYFAKQGPLVYKDSHEPARPRVFLGGIAYEKATGSVKRNSTPDNRPLTVNTIAYTNGISTVAPSEITYQMDAIGKTLNRKGPLRFTAMVAVDDAKHDLGVLRCSVHADGIKLASSPLLRRDRRHRFDVSIPPSATTLRLVTTGGGEGKPDDSGWCDWVSAAVESGPDGLPPLPSARISLPARWALLKGDGLQYQNGSVMGWKDGTQAWWDFICPADGTYEMSVTYACHQTDAGSEFSAVIGNQPFEGKVESTEDWEHAKTFSLGKVSLKKGAIFNVGIWLKKQVQQGMHLRSLDLARTD